MSDTNETISGKIPLAPRERVRAKVDAPTWQASVDTAGELLIRGGQCTEAYVSAMKDAVRDIGPYIVVAPGVAMPHARPEAGVLEPGVSIITLAEPVEFGHTTNDPVDVVIAFAALDKQAHLQALQQIVTVIQDSQTLAELRAAQSDDAAHEILLRRGLTATNDQINQSRSSS
ncbi:PTS sugar transporter subunit IIA [Isoptericola halotolerans]|uniref:PTS sugar transporter subunit IIA n=1 Tax=Isoptericola halotolerans TaxID=300560 RepID=UPI00388E6D45